MKISLGPIQYYWTRDAVRDFYSSVAEAQVDIVYLGEVVCSRRHEMAFEDWLDIADTLAARGKEVVLSTQVLTEGEGDLKLVRRVAGNGRFRVEANDMGAVAMLAGTAGWVAGPHLNLYNPRSLALLAELGATRWVAPVEVTAAAARGILSACSIEAEVFAYGRLPLAYSARCFTARRYNLQKEHCEFRCLGFPDGIPLATREGEPFLTLNGVQTQSALLYNLLGDVQSLKDAGIEILRVSPQAHGTLDAVRALRAACNCEPDAVPIPGKFCNGFWHGRPGLEAV